MTDNKHLSDRMQQRCIKPSAIEYVLYFGKIYHKAGALIYYLRECDLPANDWKTPELEKLVGTAVVVSPLDHTIITVWKDREKGLGKIKRKPKYNIEERERISDGQGLGWAF